MSETEILVEEFAPPNMTRKEFAQLVVQTTAQGYDFLTINMKVGWEERFRRNLGELLHIPAIPVKKYEGISNTKDGTTLPKSTEGDGERSRQEIFPTPSPRGRADGPQGRPI